MPISVSSAHDDYLMAQLASLPPLPAIEQLTPRIWRILGGNPGKFQLQGTNTYLIGTGRERILIDTAQGVPVWIESLKQVLASEDCVVKYALITHYHHDHVGGISDLRRISPETQVYKHHPDDSMFEIRDGQVFSVPGATLTALYTPGHAKDHMCFLLAEEDDAIFMGDNVLGHGTTVFEDLHTYMKSLNVMLDERPGVGYPAHGAIVDDAQKKLQEYIRHRQRREDQIVHHMKKSREVARRTRGNGAISSIDIVRKIYTEVSEALHLAAEHGTVEVLEKLEREGSVASELDRKGKKLWYLTGKSSL